MNVHKQSKFIIDVSASAKRPNRSMTRFFSYDSHTAEIVIQAEKEGKLIDQTLVDTVDIYFESVNQQYLPTKKLMWNDTMDISTDGLYSYILPDDFLNYEGLVAFDVYINYKNGDRADSSNRIIFEQRISAIDRAAGAVELVYIKDMEDAKQAVADKADEVMADMSGYESSLADYEHQIKNDMDQLYDSVAKVSTDEITKIRDVLSTVEQTAQEVSDHADQKIAEYDAKFVSTDQKMTELEQSQVALDAELKATQQQIIDADVYTKVEADANAEGILDKRNLSPAWSWSADGTDRFTTEYPGENLFDKNSCIGGIITATGVVSTSSADSIAQIVNPNYIPIKGAAITVQMWNPNLVDPSTYTARMAYYDSEYKFISVSQYTLRPINYRYLIYNIPQGASYARIGVIIGNNKIVDPEIKWKFELGANPTIYTPAPSEDPLNAYPKYKGLRLAPSDNPADYDWSYTDEYVDYLKSSSVSKTEFNDLAARLAALENKEV